MRFSRPKHRGPCSVSSDGAGHGSAPAISPPWPRRPESARTCPFADDGQEEALLCTRTISPSHSSCRGERNWPQSGQRRATGLSTKLWPRRSAHLGSAHHWPPRKPRPDRNASPGPCSTTWSRRVERSREGLSGGRAVACFTKGRCKEQGVTTVACRRSWQTPYPVLWKTGRLQLGFRNASWPSPGRNMPAGNFSAAGSLGALQKSAADE